MCAYSFCEFHQFLCNILPTAVHLCKKIVAVIDTLCMQGLCSKKSIFHWKVIVPEEDCFRLVIFEFTVDPQFLFIWEIFFTYNKKKRSQNDAILKVLLMIKKFFGVWDLEVETFQCFTKLSVFSVLYLFQREAEVTRNSVEVIKYSPATHEASCTSSKIPLLYHSTFPCQQTARRPSQIFQVQLSFLPNILQL